MGKIRQEVDRLETDSGGRAERLYLEIKCEERERSRRGFQLCVTCRKKSLW